MSTSETDSEPEPELTPDTVSSLTTFAHLSASHTPSGQGTVSWAVGTLASLDFRLVRKDTALHALIQNCASTILTLLNIVLRHEPTTNNSCDFIPDVTSILRPSFLHLLFQYRRLFRVIATRNFEMSSTPPAIVCWVDVVLARLGDVATFIAADFDGGLPDQSLPESLRARREEDSLRAAMQLPDNLDMLPSVLLSKRASVAARRLSMRLLLGRYILYPALSGQVGVDNNIHGLLSTLSEFVRQSATRVDGLRSALEPGPRHLILQERLTNAVAISLFAAADIAQDSIISPKNTATATFRPQTMAAAMQLLQFVLREGGYPTKTNILSPLDHLDIPIGIIIRWGIVPQWAWSIWPQYRTLHADTIMRITTAYIQLHGTNMEASKVSDLISTNSRPGNQVAMISVVIDLVFRFISALSTGEQFKQLSTGMINTLCGSCRLISQWMNRNSCGIQSSRECCKALIMLFGYLSQNEEHFILNELVIECLALTKKQCACEAWKAAAEDVNVCFLETLGQNFIQIKTTISRDNLSKSGDVYAAQLMQFLVVMLTKGIRPLDLGVLIEFMSVVGERVLETPLNERGILCESFLTCLATANLFGIELPLRKVTTNEEAIWRLGMCGGDANLFLASAFSLYITSAFVGVEPLTYLEGLEYLLDVALLTFSRHYSHEEEPLALIVLPTICDALAHLVEHIDNDTGISPREIMRLSALGNSMQTLDDRKELACGGYAAMLKRRLSLTARRVLQEVDGKAGKAETDYELLFCRVGGFAHLLYVIVV